MQTQTDHENKKEKQKNNSMASQKLQLTIPGSKDSHSTKESLEAHLEGQPHGKYSHSESDKEFPPIESSPYM